MSSLPTIDEHAVVINAGVRESWSAMLDQVEGTTSGSATAAYARAVGCDPSRASGARPLAIGSTVPGFRVTSVVPQEQLVLAGQHMCSTYELIFRLRSHGEASTELRAESRGTFPGLRGTLYRGLVIGTGFHVVAVRRMLEAIRRRAHEFAA